VPNLTLEGLDVETVEPSKRTHGGYRPGSGRKRKIMTPEQIEEAAMRIVDFMAVNDGLPPGEQFSRLLDNIVRCTPKPEPTVGDDVMALANAKEVSGVKSNSKKLPPPGDVGFDGETIDPLRDDGRLNRQMQDVWNVVSQQNDHWYSLEGIQSTIVFLTDRRHTTQAISARLRDLRKPKYGSWDVERKPSGLRGLWLYRLNPKQYAERVVQHQAAEDEKRLQPHPTGAGKAVPLPGFDNLGD
jgi:hypothetical protein